MNAPTSQTNTNERALSHIRAILTRMLSGHTHKDILMVAVKGMEFYELYMSDQPGQMKKQSLIQLLDRIVRTMPIAEDTKAGMCSFINSAEFSLAIDLIASASKGKLHLNRRRRFRRWISSCFPCCYNNKTNDIEKFEQSVEATIDSPEKSSEEPIDECDQGHESHVKPFSPFSSPLQNPANKKTANPGLTITISDSPPLKSVCSPGAPRNKKRNSFGNE